MLFKPILALHIIFPSCRNYWGGGGQNDMFATPIFHWGATAPPPPPSIGASQLSFLQIFFPLHRAFNK